MVSSYGLQSSRQACCEAQVQSWAARPVRCEPAGVPNWHGNLSGRKSHKNDFNDAEAIAEAVERPTMRFVSVRSNEQMDLQAVHRIRERLVGERTPVINQIRAFLIEYGLPVKEGRASLRRDLPGILEDAENGLSPRMRQLIASLRDHWHALESLVAQHTREIELVAKRHDDCRRLVTVPGIGPLGATALVAAVGNGAAFKKGRELAAWLSLVPRQHSTGGKPTLLGISKHGNRYVRMLRIHGARSCLKSLNRENHELGLWMTQLEERSHRNVVAVALANKIARIAWAVLARHEVYRSSAAGGGLASTKPTTFISSLTRVCEDLQEDGSTVNPRVPSLTKKNGLNETKSIQ